MVEISIAGMERMRVEMISDRMLFYLYVIDGTSENVMTRFDMVHQALAL